MTFSSPNSSTKPNTILENLLPSTSASIDPLEDRVERSSARSLSALPEVDSDNEIYDDIIPSSDFKLHGTSNIKNHIDPDLVVHGDINVQIDPEFKVHINRSVYDHSTFDSEYHYIENESKFNFPLPKLTCKKVGKFTKSLLPPLDWIPKYKKSWIPRDIIVGLTISILSIPQAMAYASLASVPPVVGLYSSFFPPLLYAVFGTSKHIMYGMFAVPCLMVGSIIDDLNPQNPNSTLYEKDLQQAEAIEICSTITFCLGLIFLLMSLFRLHFLTNYLSDNLVSGFTTAAAFHVLFSQLPKLFAIKVKRREGFFKLGLIAFDLIKGIGTTNIADFSISVFCIGILMIGRYIINPKIVKKIKVPIPFELLIVIVLTLVSKLLSFEKNYNVSVVSTIPTGVPAPQLPDFTRIPTLLPRAAPIAVVIFGTTLSVSKLFAKKHDYKVYPSQDLRAMGLISLITSFFRCHPGSGSLSRSAVASQLGGKSQFVSITCASVVLVVVLWLGPLLYHLPICVLASIIFVALQGMFMQFKCIGNLWRTSKIDFTVWIVAFLSTVLYDVSEGLLIAVGFTLLTVIFRVQRAKPVFLGRVPGTEIYRDVSKYRKLESFQGISILRFDSPLLFVNSSNFVSSVMKSILKDDENYEECETDDDEFDELPRKSKYQNTFLIVDFSAVSQIDHMGVEAIRELHDEVVRLGIIIFISTPKSSFLRFFSDCGLFKSIPKSQFFLSVHDAVLYAQSLEKIL